MSVTPVAPALRSFIDAERGAVFLLADLVDAGSCAIQTPNDLLDHLPFIKVERIGGQSTRWDDSPRIDVAVYCLRESRGQGVALALACQARLLSFPHAIPDVGVIDSVETDVSPNEVPWANAAIRLITSSYRVTVRR